MDIVNIKKWNYVELACAVNAVRISQHTDARNVIGRHYGNIRTNCKIEEDLNEKVSEEDEKEAQYNGKILKLEEDIESLKKSEETGRSAVQGEVYKLTAIETELMQEEAENDNMRKLIEEELQRNKEINENAPYMIELKKVVECQEKLENEIQLLRDKCGKDEEMIALLEGAKAELTKINDERMEVMTKKERDTTLIEEKCKNYKSYLGRNVMKKDNYNMKFSQDIKSKYSPFKDGEKFTTKSMREKLFEDKNNALGTSDVEAWYLSSATLSSTFSKPRDVNSPAKSLLESYPRMNNRFSLRDRYGMKSTVKSMENDNASGSKTSVLNDVDLNIRQSKSPDKFELAKVNATSSQPFKMEGAVSQPIKTEEAVSQPIKTEGAVSQPIKTEGAVSPFGGAVGRKSPQFQLNRKSVSINNIFELPDSLVLRKASGETGESEKVITNGLDKFAVPERQKGTQSIPEDKESSFTFAVPATPRLIQESSKAMLDYQKLNAQNDTKSVNAGSQNFSEMKPPLSIMSTPHRLKKSNTFSHFKSECGQNSLHKLFDTEPSSSLLDYGLIRELKVEESAKKEAKQEANKNDTGFISDLGIQNGINKNNENVANVLPSEEKVKMGNSSAVEEYEYKAANKKNDFLNDVSGKSEDDSGTKMLRQQRSNRLKRSVSKKQIVSPIQLNGKAKKGKKSAEKLGKAKSKFSEKSKAEKNDELKKPKLSLFETPKKKEANSGLFGSNSIVDADEDNKYGTDKIDEMYYSSLQSPISSSFDMESGNFSAFDYQDTIDNIVQSPGNKPFQFNINFMPSTKSSSPFF